jgi:hypothetical protein
MTTIPYCPVLTREIVNHTCEGGRGPLSLRVHPQTQQYHYQCFDDVTDRLVSVTREQSKYSAAVLYCLLRAIANYEPGLTRMIRKAVPPIVKSWDTILWGGVTVSFTGPDWADWIRQKMFEIFYDDLHHSSDERSLTL